MDEKGTANRPSAIPRLSRLPVSAARTPTLRVAPSREKLHQPNGVVGGDVRPSRLRSIASRDQLARTASPIRRSDAPDSTAAPGSGQHPQSLQDAARARIRTGGIPRKESRDVLVKRASNVASVSSTGSSTIGNEVLPPLQPDPPADEALFKRPLVLTNRPADVWPAPPISPPSSSSAASVVDQAETLPSAADAPQDGSGGGVAPAARSFSASSQHNSNSYASKPPRPSLAQRTIDTLAQLPSSPALRKSASAFYEPDGGANGGVAATNNTGSRQRPPSRPGSGGSRPGSSHQSDAGSAPLTSTTPQTRPGSSSSAAEDSAASGLRGSQPAFKRSLSTIPGTPSKAGQSTVKALRTPATRGTLPGQRLSSASKLSGATGTTAGQPRTPSPEKLALDGTASVPVAASAPRTLAARPLRAKPSVNGLFRKPSKASLQSQADVAEAGPKLTATPARLVKSKTRTPATPKQNLDAGAEEPSPMPSSRKSSAALREQIARAKAAKREAMRQVSQANAVEENDGPVETSENEEKSAATDSAPVDAEPQPVIESFETQDVIGMEGSDDPFNQNRSEKAKTAVLRQRLESARTTGRLNIAAMGLDKIPAEVLGMYDLESIGRADGAWAESVDLTRLVAADNVLESIDDDVFPDYDPHEAPEQEDGRGSIFGGLETLDLHGNMLVSIPMGFRRLYHLTSLNLAQNRISNHILDIIAQITSLRDLKLGNNLLYGPLDPSFSNLQNLEILDLHGNNVSALPPGIDNLSRLRILNINENSFETLPFSNLSKLPLTELLARRNKLSGTLIGDSVQSMPNLQTLDVTGNQIQHLISPAGRKIAFPCLHQLSVATNRLQEVPDVSGWPNLLTLTAEENNIAQVPEGFTSLGKIRHVDFSSNDIKTVPAEVARMESLAMLRLSGNPLRDKRFGSLTTDELKNALAARLEPVPAAADDEEPAGFGFGALGTGNAMGMGVGTDLQSTPSLMLSPTDDADSRSDMEDFTTPPTSAPTSPARSRAPTAASAPATAAQLWPVRPGGVLDRSHTASTTLHPVLSARVAAELGPVRDVQLHHNAFAALPTSLSFFAATLVTLSLAHNALVGESYLPDGEVLEFPALADLCLAGNHITSLAPLARCLRAPRLAKLDVSFNRIAELPPLRRQAYPRLAVLLISNNHLDDLDPDAIRGLRVVDAANNDIAHLNPRLGLLEAMPNNNNNNNSSNSISSTTANNATTSAAAAAAAVDGGDHHQPPEPGLERLDVMGNRFRVPRWSVLERGTEATLRWLRGRVPVAEMGAWRDGGGRPGSGGSGAEGSTSMADLD